MRTVGYIYKYEQKHHDKKKKLYLCESMCICAVVYLFVLYERKTTQKYQQNSIQRYITRYTNTKTTTHTPTKHYIDTTYNINIDTILQKT